MEVVYKADAEARGKLTGFRFEVADRGPLRVPRKVLSLGFRV